MEWMSHRKRKETKHQPGTAGPGNILDCCLVSLCFLCDTPYGSWMTNPHLCCVSMALMLWHKDETEVTVEELQQLSSFLTSAGYNDCTFAIQQTAAKIVCFGQRTLKVKGKEQDNKHTLSTFYTGQDTVYRVVLKKGTVLLSTSLAWPAVAGCSRAETFSQLSSLSFA